VPTSGSIPTVQPNPRRVSRAFRLPASISIKQKFFSSKDTLRKFSIIEFDLKKMEDVRQNLRFQREMSCEPTD